MLTVMKKVVSLYLLWREMQWEANQLKGQYFFFTDISIARSIVSWSTAQSYRPTQLCLLFSQKKRRKLMSRSTAQSYPLLYFAEKVWSLIPQKRKRLSSLPSQKKYSTLMIQLLYINDNWSFAYIVWYGCHDATGQWGLARFKLAMDQHN